MAPTTYEIRVVNGSSTVQKTYGIFCEKPEVSGGGLDAAQRIVWYKLGPIPAGGQRSFKFTSEFYAFVGDSNVESRYIENGNGASVGLVDKRAVVLGNEYNVGSKVTVGDSLAITGADNVLATAQGTFSLGNVSSHPTPNKLVVGLAKMHLQLTPGDVLPVAAVELKPGVSIIFRPSKKILIALTPLSAGAVHTGDLASNSTAIVEFSSTSTVAVVTEANDGTFDVKYT